MSLSKYIWVKGRRYYKYGTYSTINEAIKIAKYHRKKNGSRYFIVKHEAGFVFPYTCYTLYLDKVFTLF